MPLYSRNTKLPGRKCARSSRCAASAGHGHVPGGNAPVLATGAGRRKLPAPPAPATAHGHVPGGSAASAPVLAASASRGCRPVLAACAGRGQRSMSSPLCMSSSPRPSPQVAPAAATSVSALQASKFYSREAVPKAYQIKHNAATWKMNLYLCSAKIGERSGSLNPILMQICKMPKPGPQHASTHYLRDRKQ